MKGQEESHQGETSKNLSEVGIELERLRSEMREIRKPRQAVPLATAIIAGLVGIITGMSGSYIEGLNNISLERQKFEFSLVQNALEAETHEEAAANLSFLVDAGFIQDRERRIEHLADAAEGLPIRTLEERGTVQFAEICSALGGRFDFATMDCEVGGKVVGRRPPY